ncbi:protein mono-ADP-ribosyltransferase PARP12-like [Penaeus chinensis]|uniref:protein mono-ADP-ribosyltransferase PARP12-like n=1 Tax=Penaeus chinensis TaxID=139456 RepID=UPI001FB7518B|nr:protein mono-ADP-ribosyltransferase PARP12-like [Penaeus chinensis]XP_047485499.1 protein mono-ADP-ribosyltransferase PARP12-like [Penaeus chinensis]
MGNWGSTSSADRSAGSQSASTVISPSPYSLAAAAHSAGSHSASSAINPANQTGLQSTSASASQSSSLNRQHINNSGNNVAIKPYTVKAAQQTVKHCVSSDYVIPDLQTDNFEQTQIVNAPLNFIPDKFGLRACPQYNSKNGCHATLCRRYHICLFWAKAQCTSNNCDYAHDFTSYHNTLLWKMFSNRRSFDIRECIRDNHRRMRFKKQGSDGQICTLSIRNRCTRDCSKVHAKIPYQWEVQLADSWTKFSRSQTYYLEEMFSRPDSEEIELPSMERSLQTHPAFSKFYSFLSKSKLWFVNFETMKLHSQHICMNIRRLSTPSDIMVDINLATRWIWYWEDDSGSWHPYTDGASEKFYIISLSDQMEYEKINARSQNMQVKISGSPYSINIMDMYQQNKDTNKIRKIRRRPSCLPSKQKHDTSFSSQFFSLSENRNFLRHPVRATSSEFMYIKGLLQIGMRSIRVATMERIQNNHLWKAYQNKKKLLLSIYKNDASLINEQYLFHGTKHGVIDLICSDSFDWRLFGTNVGNVHGKGTYFTNDSRLSNSYSESKLGLKAVFVAFVLVGTMTRGNKDMEIPPQNAEFGRCFDTTCNDDFTPNIFVKYNKDEYYPAYIVKYYEN